MGNLRRATIVAQRADPLMGDVSEGDGPERPVPVAPGWRVAVVPVGSNRIAGAHRSWGYGCADPDYPGVYARVSAYQGFVPDHAPEATFVSDVTEPTEPDPVEADLVLAPAPGDRAKHTSDELLGASDVQAFLVEIEGDPGDLVDFKTQSKGTTDTYATLYDADGAYLIHDDDGGAGYNFQMQMDLTPDTYLLVVEGYDASVSGSYTLQAIADL